MEGIREGIRKGVRNGVRGAAERRRLIQLICLNNNLYNKTIETIKQ